MLSEVKVSLKHYLFSLSVVLLFLRINRNSFERDALQVTLPVETTMGTAVIFAFQPHAITGNVCVRTDYLWKQTDEAVQVHILFPWLVVLFLLSIAM